MTLTARVQNQRIELPDHVLIADGTEVRVVVEDTVPASFLQSIGHLVGAAEGLPEDFAAEHDHYIHGTPKRAAQ